LQLGRIERGSILEDDYRPKHDGSHRITHARFQNNPPPISTLYLLLNTKCCERGEEDIGMVDVLLTGIDRTRDLSELDERRHSDYSVVKISMLVGEEDNGKADTLSGSVELGIEPRSREYTTRTSIN
jgi:hypothetical protein